tara:strand:- start:2316 stop:2789 length:474 start_codon:yes stop_codon:yes gene_type:complete
MARRMAKSDTNPHIEENNSPLNTLALQALRRFGDFHPSTVDGDVMLMFLEFANMVIDDVRRHPYYDGDPIDYYTSPTDVRKVDDQIIVAGLLMHYSVQQASDKMELYIPMYQRKMHEILWNDYNGNTKIAMTVVDNGTNKRNINGGQTSAKNGLVTY